jgi:hypothetical protein
MLTVLWWEVLYLAGWLLETENIVIVDPVLVPDTLEAVGLCYRLSSAR